jgi:peptidoglycan/xylan/chitin deacetylase (PgdA/CDA1 family)
MLANDPHANSKVIFSSIIVSILLLLGAFEPRISFSQQMANTPNGNLNNNKVVILTFGDGLKNQYTNATPILSKYGYKASYFITCNFVGFKSRMNWQDIDSLNNQGNDIGSKTMNDKILNKLSGADLNYEVGQSKKCFQDHGVDNVTLFATPKGIGWDNATVINAIAKYYDFAVNGYDNVMYLHCNGWEQYSSQTDCRTFFDNGTLTYANRYSLRDWTHNPALYSYNDTKAFQNFVQEVNSPTICDINIDGKINAIPIIAYHDIDSKKKTPYTTDVTLFAQEMKYLHDHGFRVIRVSDLSYDNKTNIVYVKTTIPNRPP